MSTPTSLSYRFTATDKKTSWAFPRAHLLGIRFQAAGTPAASTAENPAAEDLITFFFSTELLLVAGTSLRVLWDELMVLDESNGIDLQSGLAPDQKYKITEIRKLEAADPATEQGKG